MFGCCSYNFNPSRVKYEKASVIATLTHIFTVMSDDGCCLQPASCLLSLSSLSVSHITGQFGVRLERVLVGAQVGGTNELATNGLTTFSTCIYIESVFIFLSFFLSFICTDLVTGQREEKVFTAIFLTLYVMWAYLPLFLYILSSLYTI